MLIFILMILGQYIFNVVHCETDTMYYVAQRAIAKEIRKVWFVVASIRYP